MNFMVETMLGHFPADTLRPGDALITNDIYIGAGQLQDTFTVLPVFRTDELVGFIGSSVHLMDVGGAAPGSQAVVGIYDNYQEGLRIPPVKHYVGGTPVAGVIDLIAYNTRVPYKVMGDIRAMVSANAFGARRLLEYFDRYGVDNMEACYDRILDDSEARVRAAIDAIPDGTYSNELALDDYGPDTPPVRLAVDITFSGSDVTVDWSRSDPQVPAGMNSAARYTYAYSSFALRCLLAADVPQNAGCFRPIKVQSTEGTFMNPRPPAPGGGRAITIHRHFETVLGALLPVIPDRVQGASSQWCNTIVGGEAQDGKNYVYWDILMGGFAARSTKDGAEALCSVLNSRNIPIEVAEVESPVRIERMGFVTDSGGPGRYRGACAISKDIRMLGRHNRLTPIGDRHKFPPHGVRGGESGALALIVEDPEGDQRPLHSKGIHWIDQGRVVRFQVSGAGGYGDPRERDPHAVIDDVLDGMVSRDAARERYGVVLSKEGALDEAATAALRERA
jgi:N-methylhydantoinase B